MHRLLRSSLLYTGRAHVSHSIESLTGNALLAALPHRGGAIIVNALTCSEDQTAKTESVKLSKPMTLC